jgi:hypothetical protein
MKVSLHTRQRGNCQFMKYLRQLAAKVVGDPSFRQPRSTRNYRIRRHQAQARLDGGRCENVVTDCVADNVVRFREAMALLMTSFTVECG